MCDTSKYSQIYRDIKELRPEDTLQLVIDSKDEEEQMFYQLIGNYLLRQNQMRVIEQNLF
ncbi:MAG: hypothetical protein IJ079_00435 [Lachnospiraceae bacterium]|nr:hypothetical protein [Lachnospiraceae bacterium]